MGGLMRRRQGITEERLDLLVPNGSSNNPNCKRANHHQHLNNPTVTQPKIVVDAL